jgi:nitroreductase
MDRRKFVKTIPAAAALAASAGSPTGSASPGLKPVILPNPEREGGKAIMSCISLRRTTRTISSKEIPLQTLSNILWAGFGVNRESAGFNKKGRTAPSASNSQEIDMYVALPEGVYLYEASGHQLLPVAEGDFRSRSGRRAATTAPLNIFFIADTARYDLGPSQPDRSIGDPEVQKSYYYTDTGFIAQNIYLCAASFGLAAWFHNCDKTNTVREFSLKPTQKVLFAQSVGYPE